MAVAPSSKARSGPGASPARGRIGREPQIVSVTHMSTCRVHNSGFRVQGYNHPLARVLLADIRFAVRWLRKSPGSRWCGRFAGDGIGFNTAPSPSSMLLAHAAVADPGRLVDVFTSDFSGKVVQHLVVPRPSGSERAERRVRRPRRLSPVCRAELDGRLAPRDGRDRHRQLLRVFASAPPRPDDSSGDDAGARAVRASRRHWARELDRRPMPSGARIAAASRPPSARRPVQRRVPIQPPRWCASFPSRSAPGGLHDGAVADRTSARPPRGSLVVRGDGWPARHRSVAGEPDAVVAARAHRRRTRIAAPPQPTSDVHHPSIDPVVVLIAGVMVVAGLVLSSRGATSPACAGARIEPAQDRHPPRDRREPGG